MSVNAAPNVPVARADSLEQLYNNVNAAFMNLYQQLNPVLASLQGNTKNTITRDGSTYPNSVSFGFFMPGAPTATGYVTITFSDGSTKQVLVA